MRNSAGCGTLSQRDDSVGKPFSYCELGARVRALLRRTQRQRAMGRLRVGSLEFDPRSRRVWVRREPLAGIRSR